MDRGWSINPEDWVALEKALSWTENWHSVLLTPNDRDMVPESPGVYAICAPPPNAIGEDSSTMFHSLASPLYVGRAESNIKSRFLAHCKSENRLMQMAKNCYHRVRLHFWFIELPVSAVRDAEAQLINCFGPPVNRRAGTITGITKPPINA